MGWSNPDLYNQPEQFGLVPVGDLDDPESCYSFCDLVVWHHPETYTLYWAVDSGCSCPSPFEDFTNLKEATQVHFDNAEEMTELEDAIRTHCNYSDEASGKIDENALDRVRLLDKIKELADNAHV